ncbi:unnamed protein product [Prorocentrum cordatum]|uniref:Uncharacterized protein n=1 Tax=Prorocentrum cordatum TaxID=2364126 RepID=A0ABN9VLW4_9DINO|nr:unnamed protein product [Polarella glacialis]
MAAAARTGTRMRAPDSPEGRAAGRAADRPTGPPEASPEARPAAAGSRGAAGPPEAGPPERDGPPQSSSQPAAQACDSGPCEGPGRGPPEGVPQAQEAHALLGRAVRMRSRTLLERALRQAAAAGLEGRELAEARRSLEAEVRRAEARGRLMDATQRRSQKDLFLALGEAGRLDFSKDRELVEHARDVLASLSGDAEDGCGPAAREPSEPALGSTAAGSEVQPGLEVPPAGPADDSAPAQAPRRSACGLAQAFGASPRSECRSSFSSGGVSPTARGRRNQVGRSMLSRSSRADLSDRRWTPVALAPRRAPQGRRQRRRQGGPAPPRGPPACLCRFLSCRRRAPTPPALASASVWRRRRGAATARRSTRAP